MAKSSYVQGKYFSTAKQPPLNQLSRISPQVMVTKFKSTFSIIRLYNDAKQTRSSDIDGLNTIYPFWLRTSWTLLSQTIVGHFIS